MKRLSTLLLMSCVMTFSAASEPSVKSTGTVSGKEVSGIAQWTAQLSSDDARERGEAAQRLGQAGPAAKAALPALLQIVDDAAIFVSGTGTYRVSHEALAAMRRIDPAYVFPPEFIQHLLKRAKAPPTRKKDQNAWMTSCGSQALAIESLTRMGSSARAAIPDLVRLSRNPCSGTAAREALNALGVPGADQLSALYANLNDADVSVRAATIDYLATLPAQTPGLVLSVAKGVSDPSSSVRLSTLQALEKFHPEGEARLPVLAPLLKDPSRSVREGALQMLAQMGPNAQSVIPLLKEALKDKDALLAQQAAAILSQMDVRDAEVLKALEPYREAERKREMEKRWAQSTPQERLANARTLKVRSIKTAKEVVNQEPVRVGRVFRSGEPVICWTSVMLNAAPAAVTHTWFLKGEQQAEYTIPVVETDAKVWSHHRVRPGPWKVVVTAPGIAEPLATITFEAIPR